MFNGKNGGVAVSTTGDRQCGGPQATMKATENGG